MVSAEHPTAFEVAERAGFSPPAVWRWQQRHAGESVEDLLRDETRSARKPCQSIDTVAEVLALTCSEPPGEVTHWTGRAVADAVGISLRSVQRIWDAYSTCSRTGCAASSTLPTRPFAEKVEDIVGLYVDAPRHAVVLSFEEKIQAVERTRPSQPIKPGHPET